MLLTADGVDGSATGPQAVWSHAHTRLTGVAVWTAKRAGLGEDAEPTLLHHRRSGHGLLGVYDGLGGSGARPAGRTADARTVSHAFVASRLAHLTVQDWFTARLGEPDAGPGLHDRLAEVFGAARVPGRTKLAGTLRRDLPTTLALIEYRATHAVGTVDAIARWAGDSRCYLLDPANGLQQLSRDDSDVNDALEILVADQPMTNLVSATADFTIHEHRIVAPQPCVLVCATDGFFNYVESPAMFEYHLLDCLGRAGSEPASGDSEYALRWGRELARWIRSCTADDASLVLVALGFDSFRAMHERFRGRWHTLHDEHWKPIRGLDQHRGREGLVEAREESWRRYRDRYLQRMPAPVTVAGHPHRAGPTPPPGEEPGPWPAAGPADTARGER